MNYYDKSHDKTCDDSHDKPMDKAAMIGLLNEIGQEMVSIGKIVEFAIFGGSAIIFTFDFRDATRDIDFMLISGDYSDLLKSAKRIGDKYGFVDNWFNDSVEIFASDNPEYGLIGEFPKNNPGIRVFSATPEYILAMKVMSMRSSAVANDFKDIWHIIDEAGIKTAKDVMDTVSKFYPNKELPRRNKLLLQDLFEEKKNKRAYNPVMGA